MKLCYYFISSLSAKGNKTVQDRRSKIPCRLSRFEVDARIKRKQQKH